MAYDPATEQLILFGGGPNSNFGSATFNDTWNWTGTDWVNLIPNSPTNNPPARYGASMAFDSATRELILFGGGSVVSGTSLLSDTWSWDGTNWNQHTPAHSPSARLFAAMAFDVATGQLILFGGLDAFGNVLNDTWKWTGTDWMNVSPNPSTPTNTPPDRFGASMAYDPATGQLILFGGKQP